MGKYSGRTAISDHLLPIFTVQNVLMFENFCLAFPLSPVSVMAQRLLPGATLSPTTPSSIDFRRPI